MFSLCSNSIYCRYAPIRYEINPSFAQQTYRVRQHISNATGVYRKSREGFISMRDLSVKDITLRIGESWVLLCGDQFAIIVPLWLMWGLLHRITQDTNALRWYAARDGKPTLCQQLLSANKNTDHEDRCFCLVGEAGFGPAKSVTTDLQSAPFGRSGIPPNYGAGDRSRTNNLLITNQLLCH